MAKIVTNKTGADFAFYVKGEPVVIANGASAEIADDDAAALEKQPAFAGHVEAGSVTVTGKAGRPPVEVKAGK
jgi:hypothetical protein